MLDATWRALRTVLIAAFTVDTRDPLRMALHVVDNDVDLRTEGIATGSAVVVWDFLADPQGSVVLGSNRMVNASLAQATVLIVESRRITVTGNLLANDTTQLRTDAQLRVQLRQLGARRGGAVGGTTRDRLGDIVLDRFCLAVAASVPTGTTALAAITGNVLEGQNLFPTRSGDLLPWDAFNTQA